MTVIEYIISKEEARRKAESVKREKEKEEGKEFVVIEL